MEREDIHLVPTKLLSIDAPITLTSVLVLNQNCIGVCNYPEMGQISIYGLSGEGTKSIHKVHKGTIVDASFFSPSSFECLTIGADKVIYIRDYSSSPAKHVFSFDYMGYINDANLYLTNVRWCIMDPSYILAFSSHHFIVIMRAPESNFPIYYRCCLFNNIGQAEFLPFSSNYICILSSKDHSVHIINWQENKERCESTMVINPGADTYKLYPAGAYVNETGTLIGNFNHLLTVGDGRISLWGLTVHPPFNFLQIDYKELEPGMVTDFDFLNGIISVMDTKEGILRVFQTTRTIVPSALFDIKNQYKHSLEEILLGKVATSGMVFKIKCLLEKTERFATSLKLIMIGTEGVRICSFKLNSKPALYPREPEVEEEKSQHNRQIKKHQELVVRLQNLIEDYEGKLNGAAEHAKAQPIIEHALPAESYPIIKEDKKPKLEESSAQTQAEEKVKDPMPDIKGYVQTTVIEILYKEVTNSIFPFIDANMKALAGKIEGQLKAEVSKFAKLRKHYNKKANMLMRTCGDQVAKMVDLQANSFDAMQAAFEVAANPVVEEESGILKRFMQSSLPDWKRFIEHEKIKPEDLIYTITEALKELLLKGKHRNPQTVSHVLYFLKNTSKLDQ